MKTIALLALIAPASAGFSKEVSRSSNQNRDLEHCEGHCRNNNDCANGHYCHTGNKHSGKWMRGWQVGCGYEYGAKRYNYCIVNPPTKSPTAHPTKYPTYPTASPTAYPTASPTKFPTERPTITDMAHTEALQNQGDKSGYAYTSTHTDWSNCWFIRRWPYYRCGTYTQTYVDAHGFNSDPLLEQCQGDCDYDWECKGDFKCWHDNGEHKNVPGCKGMTYQKWDYCYDPAHLSVNYPVIADFGPTPPSSDLGECVGDCDKSGHCKEGLVCFKRSAALGNLELPVPGCDGQPTLDHDYCVKDEGQHIKPVDVKQKHEFVADNSLGRCDGHCKDDQDCKGNLECFVRENYENGPAPACEGEAKTGHHHKQYCYDPNLLSEDSDELKDYGVNAKDIVGDDKLGKCVGDCDKNSDCKGDLICLQPVQREGGLTVLGCSGTVPAGKENFAYCIDPTEAPTKAPTSSPTKAPTSSPTTSPTKAPTHSPTASPTHSPTASPTHSPTASPTQSPTALCDANNCMNWNCAEWCECYDEEHEEIYASHPACEDDGEDTCICFQEENDEHAKEIAEGTARHDKMHYRQYARTHAVCGRHNPRSCKNSEVDRWETDPNALHEVRCCTKVEPTQALKNKHRMKDCATPHLPGPSESLAGKTLPGIPGVWGMSKVGSTGDMCVHSATYVGAKKICENVVPGGRLCTEKEVKAECASWTGCGHDADLIWVHKMEGVNTFKK